MMTTLTITSEQEIQIRAESTESYINGLRLKLAVETDNVKRMVLSEMIGAAESVLATWLCPMEEFWTID